MDEIPPREPEPESDSAADSLFESVGTGPLLLLAVGCLLLYMLLQGVFWGGQPGAGIWGLSIAAVGGIILPVALFIRSQQRSVRQELWLLGVSPLQVLGVALAVLGSIPVVYATSAINEGFVNPDPAYVEFLESLVPTDRGSLVAGVLAIVVLAPLGEEILFRGLILGTLGRSLRPVAAVCVTGVLFGCTHMAPWVVLPVSVLGIALGFLVLLTRTLTAAWIGHAFFNLISYVELAWSKDVETPRLAALAMEPAAWIAAPVLLGAAVYLLRAAAPS